MKKTLFLLMLLISTLAHGAGHQSCPTGTTRLTFTTTSFTVGGVTYPLNSLSIVWSRDTTAVGFNFSYPPIPYAQVNPVIISPQHFNKYYTVSGSDTICFASATSVINYFIAHGLNTTGVGLITIGDPVTNGTDMDLLYSSGSPAVLTQSDNFKYNYTNGYISLTRSGKTIRILTGANTTDSAATLAQVRALISSGGGGSLTLDQVLANGENTTHRILITRRQSSAAPLFISNDSAASNPAFTITSGNGATNLNSTDVELQDATDINEIHLSNSFGYYYFNTVTLTTYQYGFPTASGSFIFTPQGKSYTFADSADVGLSGSLTASGTGVATSFTFTVATGYTKCIVQSKNIASTVQSSSISGTTLTVNTISAPILGTNNLLFNYILNK